MVEPGSHEEEGAYPTAPDATKRAIEAEIVGEVVRKPESALSFARVFNRDPDFSRIFSRGGGYLEELKMQELTAMDDAEFQRFTERLRTLQDMAAPPEQREGR